jgi:hypothetical protein
MHYDELIDLGILGRSSEGSVIYFDGTESKSIPRHLPRRAMETFVNIYARVIQSAYHSCRVSFSY